MKAATQRTYGPPEKIQIEEVEKPIPKNGEVLVRVRYSSVNRTDDGFLRAKPFVTRFFSGLLKPRQPILGCEFAGEVVEVGAAVEEFRVGDRVFGFDDVGWGGHGEFKAIKASKAIVKIPDAISFQIAGVATEGAHYALSYIHIMQKLGVKRVLVHGATGAIGSAAVQLMKKAGFYVVATSTTESYELVRTLGADRVIDWQKVDFTSDTETFDVVFDSVGKSTFAACKKLLAPRGMYIATELGPYGQNPLLGMVSPLYKMMGRKRVLFPLPRNNKKLLQHIADCLAEGSFTPLIDRTYELDLIADAYRYVEAGQKVGNVSVKIS